MVGGTLDHCFIMTHSFHKEGDLKIYFGVIFHETRHHAQVHFTFGRLIHCALFWAVRRTQTAAQLGWGFCWPLFVVATLELQTFFAPALGLPTNLGVGRSWLFPFSSIKFLTRRSLKSRWVYLALREDNSLQLLSIANNYNGLPYLFSSVWLAHFQKPDATDMNIFYIDSETDLKLQCDYCIKFQLFEGAQDVFSRLTAVCYILLPHNPYRLPQHYKRHVCGPSCGCKHRFLWISQIF